MFKKWLGLLFIVFSFSTPHAEEAPGVKPTMEYKKYKRLLRSVSYEDMIKRNDPQGLFFGPNKKMRSDQNWQELFYQTLALERVKLSDQNNKTIYVGIPQTPPPPCDQIQPTKFDEEGCRYIQHLFKDLNQSDPKNAELFRQQVRRGREVWYKGTSGNQYFYHEDLPKILGVGPFDYAPWLDTRKRQERLIKFGLINDPDCQLGDESTFWLDKCADPNASGILGIRKYPTAKTADFDPLTSPFEEGEIQTQKRFYVTPTCALCHVSFDPTQPPADPTRPNWDNLMDGIGNPYLRYPALFSQGISAEHFLPQLALTQIPGTIDNSTWINDFIYNPEAITPIIDFYNRSLFEQRMKDMDSAEIKLAPSRILSKNGEDTMGDRLAFLRFFLLNGVCAQECVIPNLPQSPLQIGGNSNQNPLRIQQCFEECEAFQNANAKFADLASFIYTMGPAYLARAVDTDGVKGFKYIDYTLVPEGRLAFVSECAKCHSSKIPPEAIKADKAKLKDFYKSHVFGLEDTWQMEFTEDFQRSEEFKNYFDASNHRLKQFILEDIWNVDMLTNDERTTFSGVGTNRCRSLSSNLKRGNIFEEFSSESYQNLSTLGNEPAVINPLLPLRGGKKSLFGVREIIEGGQGYYRNPSLINIWATAPFFHNNALGNLKLLADGTPDLSVKGRVQMFEEAMNLMLMSDKPEDKPHREPKILRVLHDTKSPFLEDGKRVFTLNVPNGTPIASFANINPHKPIYMTCSDLVENKGHVFGSDLSPRSKKALIEFLKTL